MSISAGLTCADATRADFCRASADCQEARCRGQAIVDGEMNNFSHESELVGEVLAGVLMIVARRTVGLQPSLCGRRQRAEQINRARPVNEKIWLIRLAVGTGPGWNSILPNGRICFQVCLLPNPTGLQMKKPPPITSGRFIFCRCGRNCEFRTANQNIRLGARPRGS